MKYLTPFRIVTLSLLMIVVEINSAQGQQLKLGSNPTQIEKSAALQIDSKNQGVLLPRIDNLIDIETLLPKDGTIIYYTDPTDPAHSDAGLYIRKNGVWVRLVGSSELGIFSLNGDHTPIQTVSLTTISGTSLGFSSNGSGSLKLNIPFASKTDNGLLSTNIQSINGVKTFTNSPKINELALGSVIFIGDDHALSEDNGNLYWDNTNSRLGIGLGNGVTPGNTLEINSGITGNGGLRFTKLNAGTTTEPNAGAIGVNADGDVVRIQNGIANLNGLTAQSQNFITGTSGDDFNISSVDATHTFNLPDASATARGVINSGTQTIGGWKTFDQSPTITPLKAGSVIFVGNDSHGALASDLDALYWDQANKRLGIGTSTPSNTLEIKANNASGLKFTNLKSESPVAVTNTGLLGVDGDGNVVRSHVNRQFSTKTRALDNPYLINKLQDSYVNYSITFTINLAILTTVAGSVNLDIGPSVSGPWTTIATIGYSTSILTLLSVNTINDTKTISGWIPKNFWVRLKSTTSNSVSVSSASGQEVSME